MTNKSDLGQPKALAKQRAAIRPGACHRRHAAAFGALDADLAAEQIRLKAKLAEYLARHSLEGEQ